MVMGRNGMGRNGNGPKWSWAEMVMGRNDPEPLLIYANSSHVRVTRDCHTSTLKPTKLLAPERPCTAMTGLPNTQPLTRTCQRA